MAEIPVLVLAYKADQQLVRIPVGPTMQPDPEWSYTDAAGHFHAFALNVGLPTLEYHEDPLGAEDDAVTPWTYWYTCRRCGETVTPKFRSVGPEIQSLQGTVTWEVRAVRLTREGRHVFPGDEVDVVLNTDPQHFGVLTVQSIVTSSAGEEMTLTGDRMWRRL